MYAVGIKQYVLVFRSAVYLLQFLEEDRDGKAVGSTEGVQLEICHFLCIIRCAEVSIGVIESSRTD